MGFYFPDDVVYEIATYYVVGFPDTVIFSLISKQYKKVLEKYDIWKTLYKKRYKKPNTKLPEKNDKKYRTLCMKEHQIDLAYDPDPTFTKLTRLSPKDEKMKHISKPIFKHMEEPAGFLEGGLLDSYFQLSPSNGWFRTQNIRFGYTQQEFEHYELNCCLFFIQNEKIFAVERLKRKKRRLSIGMLGSVEPEEPKNPIVETLSLSDWICRDISSNKDSFMLNSVLHPKILQLSIDGALSRPDFLQKIARFLFHLIRGTCEVSHLIFSQKSVIEGRNKVLKKKSQDLTIDEITSFILTETENRKKFKDSQEPQIKKKKKKKKKKKNEYEMKISTEHFDPRNGNGETKKQEKLRKDSKYDFDKDLEIRKTTTKERKEYAKPKLDEEILFTTFVIGMTKREDCSCCGYRDDDIFEARMDITRTNILFHVLKLMTFHDDGIPYS